MVCYRNIALHHQVIKRESRKTINYCNHASMPRYALKIEKIITILQWSLGRKDHLQLVALRKKIGQRLFCFVLTRMSDRILLLYELVQGGVIDHTNCNQLTACCQLWHWSERRAVVKEEGYWMNNFFLFWEKSIDCSCYLL